MSDYTMAPESERPSSPEQFKTAGPVALYRAIGVLGRPYAPMPKDIRSDEALLGMIGNAVGNLREAHGSVPPDDILLAIHRCAWDHYKSPRRKKYNPQADAQRWALAEVIRAARVWATQRPDAFGTHVQYAHIADLVGRVVYGDSATPPVSEPPPITAAPVDGGPEKKLHWKQRQKMEREAGAAPVQVAKPVEERSPSVVTPEQIKAAKEEAALDPYERARRRADAIYRRNNGGAS